MGDPFMATGFGELKVFSGSAHPELTREIAAFLGVSPGQAREILTAAERRTEGIMLATRLATGCPLDDLTPAGRAAAAAAVRDGLAEQAGYAGGRVTLTPNGRLLADAVIRGLTD